MRKNPRRALVCSPFVPAFDRESGNQRIYDTVMFLVEEGWDVTLVAKAGSEDDGRHARLLRQRGVATYVAPGSDMESIVAAGQFDVAFLAFWFIGELWGSLIRSVSPGTHVVVDPIDLHFLRAARQRAGNASGTRLLDPEFAELMVRELNVYIAADAVMAVSQKEAAFLNDMLGLQGLARSVEDNEPHPGRTAPRKERRGLLFLGNFRHPPNVEAVEFLMKEIVPRLGPGVLAEHKLRIVGNSMTPSIAALADGVPDVDMVGWVPSVRPYVESSVMSLVPLLHGAGTKRKTVQSMTLGTPVVSTPVGVEGLPVEVGSDVLVAEDPAEFAKHIERLLGDDELWWRLHVRAQAQVGATHGTDNVRRKLLDFLDAVLTAPVKPGHLAHEGLRFYRKNLYSEYAAYERDSAFFIAAIVGATPPGSVTAVVSKGDDALLKIDGRQGVHFPMNEAGGYAGYHPADSEQARRFLALARDMGVHFLAFPSTSAWWLDHYPDFRRYLRESCREVRLNITGCSLFALGPLGDMQGASSAEVAPS